MLDLNQGIYEHFLRRRGDNSTIRYGVLEDFEKTYQRTATRTNFNPPPGQSALAVLKRPTFTTTKKGQVAWRKSLVVVDMLPSGEIREKFQVYMSLTEETSSVDEVQRLLKQQLGFEVILLDANVSSTDEVSSVSDKVHLELFSNFARRRHVHHMSDFCRLSRPFLVVVKVGRFCMATALYQGGRLRFVCVAVLW